MLIGVCGGICSGKKTVAQYLVDHHGFRRLYLNASKGDGNGITNQEQEQSAATLPGGTSTRAAKQNGFHPDAAAALSGASRVSPPQHHHQTFSSPEELLDYVTLRWQSRFVTTDIPTEAVLDIFMRRPFFLLLSIDAPLTVRWRRAQLRASGSGSDGDGDGNDDDDADISLEDFVSRSDRHLYDPHGGFQPLISRATVRLLNTSSSLAHLYATLGKLDIPNPDRLRPGWDTYFMALASLAAQRSNCMKRRVGCVLVGRERRVISTGYNGTPRGIRNCADGGCPRCNEGNSSGVGLATCLCIHAEENALLEAGRERIREGSVLYCDTCPCLTCSIKICQVGISEVVYAHGYSMDKEAAAVFGQAGVKLRQFIPFILTVQAPTGKDVSGRVAYQDQHSPVATMNKKMFAAEH
ncbi:Cytidine deaminase [Moelleriella libera RCEF 2490]|uniref:Deoxycytidylate deaminase n=1 Tax=Moelleriella libera RCEF 2490 TaxID=1081109 RepID=A0A166V9J1_9HYPO|nr:Cytidine deaminase [Moelleriella libera RCEF 2490]